jgi:hypothetical protein
MRGKKISEHSELNPELSADPGAAAMELHEGGRDEGGLFLSDHSRRLTA